MGRSSEAPGRHLGVMYIRVHDVFGEHYGPYLRPAGMIERGERMRVYVSANGRDMLRGSGGVFWVAALCIVTCEPSRS
jgi:hypothetical protein